MNEPRPPEHTIGRRDLTAWPSWAGRMLVRGFRWLTGSLTSPNASLAVLLVVAAGLVGAGTVAAGELYEDVAEHDGLAVVDRPLLDWILTLRGSRVAAAIAAFSHSGGPLWMTVLTGAAVALMCLRWRRWTPLVLTGLAVAGSLGLTTIGKRLAGRARPPLADAVPPPETSPSFPSGHALNSIVIAGVLVYLLLPHLQAAAARVALVVGGCCYVVAMGLSRVYLGHHWLTDVLAAWALGIAWLAVVITLHRLWLTHRIRASHGPPRTEASLVRSEEEP